MASVPRRLPGVLGRGVVRSVQTSFELRSVLVTQPRPFDGFTFYVRRWDYLAQALEACRKADAEFDADGDRLQQEMNRRMETARAGVKAIMEARREGVEEYEDALDAVRHVPGGRHKVRDRADELAREAGFDDLAEVELVAGMDASCWRPAAGHPWHAARVDWPPPRPDLPSPRPQDQIPAASRDFISWADWQSQLGKLAAVFSTWFGVRDGTLPPHRDELDRELRRHEETFKLVDDEWLPTFRARFEPSLSPA